MAGANQLHHDYLEAISKGRLAGGGAFHECLRSGRNGTAFAPTATGRGGRGRGSALLRSRTLVHGEWLSPRVGRRPLAQASSPAPVGSRNL